MTKVLVKGKYIEEIIPVLKAKGLTVVDSKPDLIVAYGGDGTLLEVAREFPNVPKLPIRDYRTAPLCAKHSAEQVIDSFVKGQLKELELLKISGKCLKNNGNKTVWGINDIFIHNVARNSAVRFRVWIDDELYLSEVASDCIGFATPHGSTGYFQSITQCIFKQGIGIAVSNSREHVNHIIVPEDSIIKIDILRGPAVMVADNSPQEVDLDGGDELIISKSSEKSTVYGLDAFMCYECRKLRHMKI